MDLRSWIILFPLTFLLASDGVVLLSRRLLKRWSLRSPEDFNAAFRIVAFLSLLLFMLMLIPMWGLVLRYHDHAVYFLLRRVGGHFFSLGLMTDRRLTFFITAVTIGCVMISKQELGRGRAKAQSTPEVSVTQWPPAYSDRQALLLLTTQLCFSIAVLSADLLQMMVFAILGFWFFSRYMSSLYVSAGGGERAVGANLLLRWGILPLLMVGICALWLTFAAHTSEATGIKVQLPGVSTSVLAAILWLTIFPLLVHAMVGFGATLFLRSLGVALSLFMLCVWLLMDLCLFYRVILSTMPPWILARI